MKFLATPNDTEQVIKRLISKCERLRWAVAWASRDFPLCNLIKDNQQKIQQLVVGIHFYQTHPDFIATFQQHESVRFVLNPDGVFHPKLYLFEMGSGKWQCITGSPNFTHAAFSGNVEAAVQFSDEDFGAEQAYDGIASTLDGYFAQGKSIDDKELAAYRSIWKRQQRRLSSLSGRYEPPPKKTKPRRSPLHVPLFVAEWPEYFDYVKDDRQHTTEGRLAVLEEARQLFGRHRHFYQMDDDARRGIAGIADTDELQWTWFGSMKGHFYFPNAVTNNNRAISDALDEIPITGGVTQDHFERYVAIIRTAFEKAGTGTATRLLAFKRPDYFVCLDQMNRKKLCDDFKIIPKSVTLDDYWEKIVQRVIDSNWWNSPEPEDELERRIWRCRAAFLDVKFYEPKE